MSDTFLYKVALKHVTVRGAGGGDAALPAIWTLLLFGTTVGKLYSHRINTTANSKKKGNTIRYSVLSSSKYFQDAYCCQRRGQDGV